MASIDAVIQALRDYTGTLIFVSHDLHFIRALGKRTIRIESGKITNFAGDYDYYLWKSGAVSAQTGLIEGLSNARPEQNSPVESGGKVLSAKEKRRVRSQEREKKKAERGKLEDKVRRLEKEIMQLEEEQNLCNAELANPDSYNDPEKARELNAQATRLSRHLQQRNYEWEIETEKLLLLQAE
jgi:ATP-binding cassette subfamily F protein 3